MSEFSVAYNFEPKAETPEPSETIETQEVNDTPEIVEEEVPVEVVEEEAPTVIEAPIETADTIDDNRIIDYLNKKNGTSFKTIDEYNLSLSKEIIKEVPKPEAELDDDIKAYQRFKKETNGSFQDWMQLNQNVDERSDLEVALDKIKAENKGLKLSDADAFILLSEELGIENEDFNELEPKEKLKLSVLANKHRLVMKAEQDKYREPSKTEPPKNETQPSNGEKVMIDGQLVDKAVYEQQRREYLTERENVVKSIEKDVFGVKIVGSDGKETELNAVYVYTDEDKGGKQGMLSLTESIDSILPRFITDGKLNHSDFNKGMWWAVPENREKAIQSIIQQARSAGVDEVLKQERNIDFEQPTQPAKPKKQDGYGEVGAYKPNDEFSVAYKFNG